MKNTVKVNPERIRALRDKARLTQDQLARKMRPPVDPGTVSRWERGEICDVRRDTLGRLVIAGDQIVTAYHVDRGKERRLLRSARDRSSIA